MFHFCFPDASLGPQELWLLCWTLTGFLPQDERERIEALGGFVSHMDCWRVNGTLAVSRAIGKGQACRQDVP